MSRLMKWFVGYALGASLCVLLAVSPFDAPLHAAQGKGNANNRNRNTQEKKDDERVRDAREDVQDAEKKIQELMKNLRTAEGEENQSQKELIEARKQLDEIRDRVQQQHEQKAGVPKLIDAQSSAQQAYDVLAKPALEKLQQTPEFRAAEAAATKAQGELSALAKQTGIDPTERQRQTTALQAIMKKPQEMKQGALDAIPDLKPLKERLTAVQQQLASARDSVRRSVEASSDVVAAERKVEKAKQLHDARTAKIEQMKREIAASQQKLASERRQVQQAVMQDKKNDNPPKKNNQKGKK